MTMVSPLGPLSLLVLLSSTLTVTGLYRWRNDEIESIRTEQPQPGQPLILAVRHRQEYSRANCSFTPPLDTSISYHLVDGQVTDQTGQVVDGVEAWDDGGDPSVCGIRFVLPLWQIE